MLFTHEKFLVSKLETFKNCKKVNKAHYDYDYSCNLHFFILCDIWSTVKNYFLKNLRPPWKNPLSPFYSLPSKNSKIASLPLFANIENFLDPPCRKGGRTLCFMSFKFCETYVKLWSFLYLMENLFSFLLVPFWDSIYWVKTVFFFTWAVLELSFLPALGIINLYFTIFITIKIF